MFVHFYLKGYRTSYQDCCVYLTWVSAWPGLRRELFFFFKWMSKISGSWKQFKNTTYALMSARLISSASSQYKTTQMQQARGPRCTSQSARIIWEHYDPLDTDGVVDNREFSSISLYSRWPGRDKRSSQFKSMQGAASLDMSAAALNEQHVNIYWDWANFQNSQHGIQSPPVYWPKCGMNWM